MVDGTVFLFTKYGTSLANLLIFVGAKVRRTRRAGIAVKIDGNAGTRTGIDGR